MFVQRSRVDSVLTGLMAFCVIFSVSFALGRSFLRSTEWLPSSDGEMTLSEELRGELARNPDLTAVVVASGAIAERIELHSVEVLPRQEWPSDPWTSPAGMVLTPGSGLPDSVNELPAFVGAKFSGSGFVLTIDAGEVAIGEEWSVVGAMVLTDPTGGSFFGTHGECALRLWTAGWSTESLGFGSPLRVVRSTFSGELRCVDVPEIRTGTLVSLVAAFRLEP